MRDAIMANVSPCDHSLVGCPECRKQRAARESERPQVSPFPPTKGTQDLLLAMLDDARREIRDQASVIGRLGAENQALKQKLDELKADARASAKTKQRTRKRKQ